MIFLSRSGFPPQAKYIVWNEACERFSYYGMRSILTVFMIQHLKFQEHEAKSIYHLFITASYFLPLVGAFLSDRFWGKYRTIFWLSLVYCLGHLVLALFESRSGLFWGLGLIAIGAGGIKPCVSAFVGDQFTKSNQHLLEKIFSVFYWAVNIGAFASMVLVPKVLVGYGPSLAFALPGILMIIATAIFWAGRRDYINVPPTGPQYSGQFWPILAHCLRHLKGKPKAASFLDSGRGHFDPKKIEAAESILGVLKVFFFMIAFWALYDQQGSSWVLQAEKMQRTFLGVTIESSQMQSVNGILILALIPIFSWGIYPLAEKWGLRPTALRKISVGLFISALAFVSSGVIQALLDRQVELHILWQLVPYILVSASEVLVSITGLEFAYTQAPPELKSTLMSLFFLTISLGNLLTAAVSWVNPFAGQPAHEYAFYAALMTVFAVLFSWASRRFRVRSYVVS